MQSITKKLTAIVGAAFTACGYDESLGEQICVTVVATDFPDTSYLDPTWEIGNEHKTKIKVQLSTNNNNEDADEPIPGTERIVKQGNYLVREKLSPEQTEINWDKYEANTPDSESDGPLRVVPVILAENADIDELENIPAYKRKQMNNEYKRFTNSLV